MEGQLAPAGPASTRATVHSPRPHSPATAASPAATRTRPPSQDASGHSRSYSQNPRASPSCQVSKLAVRGRNSSIELVRPGCACSSRAARSRPTSRVSWGSMGTVRPSVPPRASTATTTAAPRPPARPSPQGEGQGPGARHRDPEDGGPQEPGRELDGAHQRVALPQGQEPVEALHVEAQGQQQSGGGDQDSQTAPPGAGHARTGASAPRRTRHRAYSKAPRASRQITPCQRPRRTGPYIEWG